MKRHEANHLTPHEARRIAVEACVCERTVRRYFCGLPVRSTCLARIDAALTTLGLEQSVSDHMDVGVLGNSAGTELSADTGAK